MKLIAKMEINNNKDCEGTALNHRLFGDNSGKLEFPCYKNKIFTFKTGTL
jgi:hypothetical protein